jgi:opacity protein-like surface antigen
MRSLTRSFSATVLAVAALAAGTVAHAQGSNYSLYGPGASYVGLNAGKSDFSVGNGTGVFASENKDTAYNIYGGSYFNNNLGMELGFTDFGKVNRAGGTTKAQGFNLSLVGRLPLSPSFNLLGKLGTTYGRTDVSAAPASGVASGSESGFGVSYGLGAEYAFTPQLSAVLQYDSHDLKFAGSGRDRVSATTAGLRYKF